MLRSAAVRIANSRVPSVRSLGLSQTGALLRPSARLFASPAGNQPHRNNNNNNNNAHDNHGDAEEGQNSTRLLMLASAAIFGPLFWKLTEDHIKSGVVEQPKSKSVANSLVSKSVSTVSAAPVKKTDPVPRKQTAIPKVTYVLVGAGTASYSAIEAIREAEPNADILIIGDEDHVPYMRPPLSKELWFSPSSKPLAFNDWHGAERSLFYQEESNYERVPDAEELLQPAKTKVRWLKSKVSKLDLDGQYVVLGNGDKIKYGKVLLATGATPNKLPVFEKLSTQAKERVLTFRTLDDYEHLLSVANSGKTIAIVGGGFLGSELAVALAQKAKKGAKINVVQIFPEEGNMSQVFPRYLTRWTTQRIIDEGVQIKNSASITSVKEKGNKIVIGVSDQDTVEADYVVVAAGVSPNVEIAKASGLEIDSARGGIVVNAELEARHNVFVAGDASSFHDIALGRRRVEHYDHAINSGRQVGENMTKTKRPYVHQPMFWSDLGPKIGYEAVGITESSLSTIGIWAKGDDNGRGPAEQDPSKEDYGKGVVFYISKEKKIVGILMWNIFGKAPVARKIISQGKTFEDIEGLAGLFNVHEQ
ncbi:uncharacterized protein BJ171DRAFT_507245 [Polychytrium aggregatum]|uniref:uncharacterized protein n=1 Tax=Polychytrium aggregatum TaxID=110093 RepID=UPI0022FF282F|nr:uncharacterized protein BJ171DRAFT_507245 [Polychytrium aggregatum]KAI9203982.1 hypothetical protein BJ171DRAFT_507245 [Polychytrium aggregatum]